MKQNCEIEHLLDMDLYSKKEAAAILGVKTRTLGKYKKQGILIPALYIRKRPRYTLESICAVAENNNQTIKT